MSVFSCSVTNPPDTLVSRWHGCGVQGWLNVAQSCSPQEDWLRETSVSCYWGLLGPLMTKDGAGWGVSLVPCPWISPQGSSEHGCWPPSEQENVKMDGTHHPSLTESQSGSHCWAVLPGVRCKWGLVQNSPPLSLT